MNSRVTFAAMMVFSISLCLLVIPAVLAHAPNFPGSNESLSNATVVEDPTKSWAIYTELNEGGEAQYYRLDMKAGQNIYAQLTVPRADVDRGFVPNMVLMGPALNSSGDVPSFVQRPENGSIILKMGQVPDKVSYEPFTPSAFYDVADISLSAPVDGTYYVAVFDLITGGNYGVAIGQRESFTVSEWLLIPFDQLSIYQWEGQNLVIVLLPWVLTVFLGFAAIAMWRKKEFLSQLLRWQLCVLGGLMIFGSGISVLYQMIYALSQTGWVVQAAVTMIFAIISLALGYLIVIRGLRPEKTGERIWRRRVVMIVLAAVALVFWGGLIVGPAIVIVSSLLPPWRSRAP